MRRLSIAAILTATALLGTAVPVQARFTTGSYQGSTAQEIGISFFAGKRAVRNVSYAVRYRCSTGRSYYGRLLEDTSLYPIRGGHFGGDWSSDTGATNSEIHGRLRGKRARGWVRRTIQVDSAAQEPDPEGDELCDSGVLRFRARLSSRRPLPARRAAAAARSRTR
jgi:hypothetical protein